MLVIIPYYARGAQGHELQIALKGWSKFCKSDYHVVIAGEEDPCINDPHCEFFYSERVEPIDGSYRPHLDYAHIFKVLRQKFPKEEGFVWAADDNYPVKDFDESWLRRLRYLTDIPFSSPVGNGWSMDKYFTYCKMMDLGLPTRNWTTHLPCWFDFDKLLEIIDEYSMESQSLTIEDAYFNTYHGTDEAELCSRSRLFLTSKDEVCDVKAAAKQYMWICNAVEGWSEELEHILNEYYGY